MGRCLLFAGESYYPEGGWGDFIGRFRGVAAAMAHVKATKCIEVHPAHVRRCDLRADIRWSTSCFSPSERLANAVVGATWGDGTIIARDGDMAVVSYPERVVTSYGYDWAQVVRRGKVVHEWAA